MMSKYYFLLFNAILIKIICMLSLDLQKYCICFSSPIVKKTKNHSNFKSNRIFDDFREENHPFISLLNMLSLFARQYSPMKKTSWIFFLFWFENLNLSFHFANYVNIMNWNVLSIPANIICDVCFDHIGR